MNKKTLPVFGAACGGIVLLAVFTRMYLLGQVPSGMHIDEAGMGYDAWCLANYGVDRYLQQLPVHFINFGHGQNALYTYLYALLLKITGGTPELFTMRIPAVLISFIMIACSMKLGLCAYGKKGCLLAGFLTTVCPVFIMSSRWGLESYLLYGMCTISVTCLVMAVRAEEEWRKIILFGVTGILFGLALYTYAMSYLIIPVFLVLVLPYLLYCRKITFKHLMIMGVPLALLALPLLLFLWVNSQGIGSMKLGPFTIPLLPYYRGDDITLSHIFLSPQQIIKSMFFNDYLGYSAYDGFYTLYPISIPFAVIGLVVCIKRSIQAVRQKHMDLHVFILAFLFAFFVQGRLMNGEMANINQINCVFFPLWFLVMAGIIWVGQQIGSLWGKRVYFGAAAGVYIIYLCCFLFTYLVKEPTAFQPSFKDGWDFIDENVSYEYCYADYSVQKIFYLFDHPESPYEGAYTLDHQEYHGNVNCYMTYHTLVDAGNVYIVLWSNEEWMNNLRNSELQFTEKGFDGYSVFYIN